MKKINTEVSIRVTKSYSVPLYISEYVHDRSIELGCSASEFVARCIKQEMKSPLKYPSEYYSVSAIDIADTLSGKDGSYEVAT